MSVSISAMLSPGDTCSPSFFFQEAMFPAAADQIVLLNALTALQIPPAGPLPTDVSSSPWTCLKEVGGAILYTASMQASGLLMYAAVALAFQAQRSLQLR